MPRYLQSYCTCAGVAHPQISRVIQAKQAKARKVLAGTCREEGAVSDGLAGAHADVSDAQPLVLRAAPVKRLRQRGAASAPAR